MMRLINTVIIHYRDDNEIIENFGHRSWDDDDI